MIIWNTDTDLGKITVNENVNIQLTAISTDITNELIFYSLVPGSSLPPNLNLNINGKITGNILQDKLLTFDGGTTSFDENVTTFENYIKFTVKAQGQINLEYSEKEFKIYATTIAYVNIIAKPYLTVDQRIKWNDFISNSDIFIPKYMYTELNIKKELEILIFAGIEQDNIAKYISVIGLNHRKKQFAFGQIEIAQGIPLGQRDAEYEVVYVRIYDPLEINTKILPNRLKNYHNQQEYLTADHDKDIFWTRDPVKLATPMPIFSRVRPHVNVDTTGYFASDPTPVVYFPNSIRNWRKQILNWKTDEGVGFSTERNYLPLWMRTIQPNQYQELGYIPAVVLCYCIPGTANKIKANIENYIKTTGFNFNQLDFTVDRFIISNNQFFFRRDANIL